MAAARKVTTRAAKTTETAVAAVKEITPKTAMDKLAAAKQAIAIKLAEVDAATLERISELSNLDIAIAQRKQEIQDLHGIEVTAETKAQLDAELVAFRESMATEQDKLEFDHNELVKHREKQFKQEAADHAYEIAQRDKQDADTFKFMQEQRQRAEDLRIAALTEREKKMTELEAAVAAMPGKIDEAVKTQVAAATESLKTKYEHAATVERMNLVATNKLLEEQIKAVKEQNAALAQSRSEAVSVAEKARNELNALAQAAVNASSGREALKAVQESQPSAPAPTGRGR